MFKKLTPSIALSFLKDNFSSSITPDVIEWLLRDAPKKYVFDIPVYLKREIRHLQNEGHVDKSLEIPQHNSFSKKYELAQWK